MKKLLPTGLLLLLCLCSSGALFFRRYPQVAWAEDREVSQSCLDLADAGSCDFYTCFEDRLPCGRDGYVVRHGQHYCNKMVDDAETFTPQGRRFLNDSRICLTRSLKDLYQRDQINCGRLETEAINYITSCFADNAFCDIYQENSEHFVDIFELRDLFSTGATRMWRVIASLTARCGAEAARELTSRAGETIIDALNNFFQSIASSFSSSTPELDDIY